MSRASKILKLAQESLQNKQNASVSTRIYPSLIEIILPILQYRNHLRLLSNKKMQLLTPN